jgi:hypothetical protein
MNGSMSGALNIAPITTAPELTNKPMPTIPVAKIISAANQSSIGTSIPLCQTAQGIRTRSLGDALSSLTRSTRT